MQIVNGSVSYPRRQARAGVELSRAARVRLAWTYYYEAHGRKGALTCRHFGISRQAFYRWKGRYRPGRLESLEERSRRPHRVRHPTWGRDLALAVLHLRKQYPRWGKDKPRLVSGLRRAGWTASTSMVGRILTPLKARGILREPPLAAISTRNRTFRRPYAARKPRGYAVEEPGALIQVDTLDVRSLPGTSRCIGIHRPRHDLPLGRGGSPHPSYRHDRNRLP